MSWLVPRKHPVYQYKWILGLIFLNALAFLKTFQEFKFHLVFRKKSMALHEAASLMIYQCLSFLFRLKGTNIVGREILTKYAISLIISLCFNFPEGTRIRILIVKKSKKNRLHLYLTSQSIYQSCRGQPGSHNAVGLRAQMPSVWPHCLSHGTGAFLLLLPMKQVIISIDIYIIYCSFHRAYFPLEQ